MLHGTFYILCDGPEEGQKVLARHSYFSIEKNVNVDCIRIGVLLDEQPISEPTMTNRA